MDNKELTIEPIIFFGPGVCPDCGRELSVLDSEMTFMELNQDGIPISEETNIRCIGMCLHCNKQIDMIRWKGGYVPYSKSTHIYRMMMLQNEAKDRLESLNNSSNKDNPFKL